MSDTATITDLTGVDTATLQQWLSDAQNALHLLMIGQKEVSIQITGGGQHRQVTFNQTTIAALSAWIKQLQRALGLFPRRRRALAVSF